MPNNAEKAKLFVDNMMEETGMDLGQKYAERGSNLPYWVSILGVLVLVGIFLSMARSSSLGLASPAGVCPTVQATQRYTFLYGEVTLNAAPAPLGSVVEARSPRGDTVGCQVVENAGEYPLMYVYGEETVAGTTVPGMRTGEVITFAVNGQPATPNLVPTWANDWASHQVDLSATSASCPYDFNDTPGVDIGDLALIAGAWRATDAGSLAPYNFNGNSFVDIEDIMTVAKRLGEPCP